MTKKLRLATIIAAFAASLFMQAGSAMASTYNREEKEIKMRLVLEQYNSPMQGLESVLIDTAERYNLDWTLLAAIAGVESSFARRMPAACINPFGWGIYGDNRLCFESLKNSIEQVGEGLGTRYNTASLYTIAKTYNPTSDTWMNKVSYFMRKIQTQEIPVSELPITL